MDNRGKKLANINAVFFFVSFISLLLRFYVRLFIVKKFLVDDYFSIVGTSFFALSANFSTVSVKYGLGQHLEDVEISHIFMTVKWQPGPASFLWDSSQSGVCVGMDFTILATVLYSVPAILSDLATVSLSAVTVWKLELYIKTKVCLIPILSMGCKSCIAFIAQFPSLVKLKEPDLLWNAIDMAVWSTVEQGLAITACSLATLRPLLKLVRSRFPITENSSPTHLEMSPRDPSVTESNQHCPKSTSDTAVNSPMTRDINHSFKSLPEVPRLDIIDISETNSTRVDTHSQTEPDNLGIDAEGFEWLSGTIERTSSSILNRNIIQVSFN
ncbi:related to integral membrane protein PTH11 [Fusarium fujikuroi IMI 58289]|uniref:Related to integral membrane protein PTH11 n=1 Tax=Gibberella fujikuroi (strain CBS 195.34 / IMI 58289 / NRRL A-6831) TaxID=1279085 RepID=S0EGK2_GIBF5|nr:related to integral membrane protein PTH11 [Fusarium fujikuroi IMI 58289]CCT74141.1 related to integral membrane protein PTH11 [Fusarium fujikuroi IMI 58289]